MSALPSRHSRRSDPLEVQFKSTVQDLSQSVVDLIKVLNQPARQVSASALGSTLASLLKCIRAHRGAVLALDARAQEIEI